VGKKKEVINMKVDYVIDRVSPNGAYISVGLSYNCPIHKLGHDCSLSIPFSSKEAIIAEVERMVKDCIKSCLISNVEEMKQRLEYEQSCQKTKERLQEVGLDKFTHHGVIDVIVIM
jgi:hypothetical protein